MAQNLLIAPKGIEISEKPPMKIMMRRLLIAPKGIEILPKRAGKYLVYAFNRTKRN